MLRAASLAALSLLAALVVACGGGAADGGADPAGAVPANALFYGEVAVRPEGDLEEDALTAAGKVLRTEDPEGKLREWLDRALAESGDREFDYDKDIKPWLGERAALWFGSRLDAEGDPAGAAVVAVTDTEKAMDAMRKAAANSDEKLTKRSYKDVDYEVDADNFGVGTVDDFLLLGPEPELKAAIDAQKGDSLAETDAYKRGVDALDDERLAHFWMDTRRLFEMAAKSSPNDQEVQQLRQLVPFDKLPPVVGSFAANGDRLALDFAARAKASDLGPLAGGWVSGGSGLVAELPGDSWAALGAEKYGETLKATFDAYAGMFGGPAVKEQLRQRYGIDLNADLLDWVGDVAFFIRGDSVQTLEGAAVIEVVDSAKAQKGFSKLVGLLQQAGGVRARPTKVQGAENAFAIADPALPKAIVLARSAKRVVVSFGEKAAADAFSPASKLGDSEVYDQAKSSLGSDMEPTLLLSMPAVIRLVDSSGSADAEFEQARPYLEAYDVIAYGFKSEDDGGRLRVVAGLK